MSAPRRREGARSFRQRMDRQRRRAEEQSVEAVPEEVPAADLLGTADAREAAALLNRFSAGSPSSRKVSRA